MLQLLVYLMISLVASESPVPMWVAETVQDKPLPRSEGKRLSAARAAI